MGPNGSGKSNVLESIYILSQGDSFRFGSVHNWIQHGENECLTRLLFEKDALEYEFQFVGKTRAREFFSQKKKVSSRAIQEIFPVILFSPESLESIKGASEQRRLLIDEVVRTTQQQGPEVLEHFQKSLKTRNRLLKQLSDPAAPHRVETQAVLESFQSIYLQSAEKLVLERLRALKNLTPWTQKIFQAMTLKKGLASFEYAMSDRVLSLDDPEIELNVRRNLQQRAEQLFSTEMSTGLSLVGPHKHDIRVLVDQKDSRVSCSQGQQRALILALKMAHIVYHRSFREVTPVLLLDDVLSELDARTQIAFLEFLQQHPGQVFLTSTSLPEQMDRGQMQVTDFQGLA